MKSFQQLLPRRPCPICSHKQVNHLYSQTFSTLNSGSLLSGYDVVICSKCGFGFADHIPLQQEFDRYYRDMSKYEFQDADGKESSYDSARFEAISNLIAGTIQDEFSGVLDIGCATGGLLYRIKQKGFKNVTGLDPSPACAALAWRRYEIPVLTKTISELAELQEKYDFIILVGVLEHLRDVRSHMEIVKRLLTRTGRVFIEIPDALRFDQWPDAPFQQFSMEHVNFFSSASLQNLMSVTGFYEVQSAELAREQSRGTWMPVVAAVYEQTPGPKAEMHPCTQTQAALSRYIQYSEAVETRIQQIITQLAVSQQPIVVWGTGTHTLHLMETSDLPKTNIVAFVDSNMRYQNKTIKGVPIVAPTDISRFAQPILISSRVFQDEIVKQIKNSLHLSNDLILLYNDI